MASIARSTSSHQHARTVGRERFARHGLATVLAAPAANVLVYYAGAALVPYDPRFLPLGNVSGAIIFTLPATVVAVLLYAALRRFNHNPAHVFTVIAAVVFIVTLVPDGTYVPTIPGATAAQIAILVLMHIVAAVVIVGMLTAPARSRGR